MIRISDVSDISEKFCLIHFQDMKLSHIDYPKAIKNKLKEACDGEFSSYLLDPKLTSLRTICEIIVDRELSKADENTFRLFFNIAKEDDLKKGIQKFDIDRLKPIQFFIKRENYNAGVEYLEILAIMVDFKPRPLSNFIKNDSLDSPKSEKTTDDRKSTFFEPKEDEKGFSRKKKIGFWILGFTVMLLAGYGIKELVVPEKQCMVWKGDHYEKIDCQDEKLGLIHEIVIPFDENEFELRKIKVCDTTTFLKNGKAIVWYGKKDGEVTFFNQDGRNPENGDELKEITTYMINKYVGECD
ncbi:hypothetical protein G6042_03580 [Flavobacterium sp. SE-s27]|uniref:Uncharacterized protein n=2 Tax=Flavobacterium solisilvae TaxID=1852019 RepID=A0ABX1QRQ3_9FLAO|nr:hypothetical protein [Flavobacterium solisilvae]